ncbi:MAG TPA: hypothetical protein VMB18_05555 [Terriglobales bacterium]|nr:hypothetical protein [Terriglobales bacterium]
MRHQMLALSLLPGLLLCSASAQQKASSRTAEVTVRGCITGGERYTFMQAGTGAMFQLQGETDRFAPVRGKLVEITADEFAPRDHSELPILSVNNMRLVADKCPIHAHPESKAANPAPANRPSTRENPATTPYTDPGTATQAPPNENDPNISGAEGPPSPGTGNPPKPPQQ